MAAHFLGLPSQLSFTTPIITTASSLPPKRSSMQTPSLLKCKPWRVPCAVSTEHTQTTENNRRTANYQPNHWNFDALSLRNNTQVEAVQERATKLEEEVRGMINSLEIEPRSLLDLVDKVKRLGLNYKFEEDIEKALEMIVSVNDTHKSGLHFTALSFRLLREHGFHVSQDVFGSFKDKEGSFKAEISNDVQGLLSLYDASYLAFEGETLLDEAREFSRTHLNNKLKEATATKMAKQVSHALELPYHRRLQRLEARWFIDNYEEKTPHDHLLLELAKLDFNMVQSLMQNELQELSRWWREIGLASKLDFVRDRLMEVYFWALGMAPHPQLSNCRKVVTKMFGLVTIIDDVYDVYGTLDDLQLFTDAVERWDVHVINALPEYMKLCFLALYNTVNDTAYTILKEKEENNLPCLAKSWSNLCKAFLQEAKWSNNKIIPAFDEYLENALVSSSGGALLAPSYFLVSPNNTNQALDSLTNCFGLVRSSCTIFRLCNDLATSEAELERGETTNSITSYMHETWTSEEQARQNLRILIDTEWKKMNEEQFLDSKFPKAFMEIAINMARVSHCTYQFGDGLGRPDNTAQNRIKLLLIEPIPISVTT
ncbi:isoprene synthase, chloroplastic-like [Abrus precatorius]|uniref:Isoprene synthase, chloroplastic-like n=1 Tax=Abrus precatorius TaxID=3816 RepID=A0A8B8JUG1_ABRPR|nr:isoprene synthase, chloroplastic-like [Abrus precatorius]